MDLLLRKTGQYDMSEETCQVLHDQEKEDQVKGVLYHQFAVLKTCQAEYQQAFKFYEKTLNIERAIPSNNSQLILSYMNIGNV